MYIYSYNQNYIGTFDYGEHEAGSILLKQAYHYLEIHKRMELAKMFLISSYKNMLSNINYYLKQNQQLEETKKAFLFMETKIEKASTIEQLLSVEGRLRQLYYQVFKLNIKKEGFKFVKRSYFPPLDQINALISFLNMLLYNTIST